MRIGMISPYSLTLPGGVQGQILSLASALTDRGIEVRILGPCDGPPPNASITPLGNSLPTASNGSIAPISPDPSAISRTIRALKNEQFDVIHLHEPLCPGPTVTTVLVKPAPLVGTFHAAGNALPYKWIKPLVKPIAGLLDVRCAVSPAAARVAKNALGGDYTILFNGIETDCYTGIDPQPSDTPTILFLGRHEPRKGLKILIQAMAELPSDIRLEVAGQGPETQELISQTANDPRIKWLGQLSTQEKNECLVNADIFCVPSLSGESFGVVLLEAMAAKTPIVASDIEGYADVAEHNQDAILVPPGDPSALASGILKVLGNKELSNKLIKSGSQKAESYSIHKLAEEYEKIYMKCMKPSWQKVNN